MESDWKLNSVIYQIYPRTFQDSNNDGIGDLPGIISRLDYIKNLGVTAIWLSPIYRSPQIDFGYDVSDYKDIDPIFGTLADFERLVQECKERKLQILMDYIPNHTSSQHPWFQESRSSKNNLKSDWYIWGDAGRNGEAPNNWLSVFGGSAWEFDEARQQYYLHTFDKSQPDLNWRNPDVQEEMFDVLRFWMDKGVDGFRVDVPYHIFKDPLLRDESPNPDYAEGVHNFFNSLHHVHTAWLPESMEMMRQFAEVLQEYKNKFMVAEAWGEISDLIKLSNTVGWRYFVPFNFSLITLPWRADVHKEFIDMYDSELGGGYLPCYVLGNHDTSRIASRVGQKQARVGALLQLTLRGLPFIYNGEELGMIDGEISREMIKDIFEINSPGLCLGRDPQRTPMQWDDTNNAGFSTHIPWLPVGSSYRFINVKTQEEDPHSMLSLYKLLIHIRNQHGALREGNYVKIPQPQKDIFAFIREKDASRVLVLANFSKKNISISLDFHKARMICNTSLTGLQESVDLNNFIVKADEGYVFVLE